MAPAFTSCCLLSSRNTLAISVARTSSYSPECVMFSSAPVAFLCTLISFDLANLVSGLRAPDRAIFALLSSWVARFVIHPTALHCTSTFGDIICRIKAGSPPSSTMRTLFSARRISTGLSWRREGLYHSQPSSPALHLRHVALRYRGFAGGTVLAQVSPGRLLGHLNS
jgi:hypothetical protein